MVRRPPARVLGVLSTRNGACCGPEPAGLRDHGGLTTVLGGKGVSSLIPPLSSLTALVPQGQLQLHPLGLQLPQSSLNLV